MHTGAPNPRRYSSLLNSVVCLTSALEEARPLLLVGAGARGIAPLRAALEWAPVQVGRLTAVLAARHHLAVLLDFRLFLGTVSSTNPCVL
jgi:hypothetical protein